MNPVLGCWVLLILGAHRSSCEGESLVSQSQGGGNCGTNTQMVVYIYLNVASAEDTARTIQTEAHFSIGDYLAPVDDCGKVDAITGDERTRAPWLAGIMWRVTGELLMAGTIVDRYTILTVFGGDERLLPLENKSYSLYSQEYMVAVGLLSDDPNQADEHTQMEQVSNIGPYEEADPEDNLFLLKLRKPLKMGTPYVRSACLPIVAQHLPYNDDGQELQAVQGAFVYTDSSLMYNKKALQVLDFRLKKNAFCDEKAGFSKSLANYVYCGQVSPNQSVTCPTVGSAAVTLYYKSRWFVIGIHGVGLRPPFITELLKNTKHPVILRSWCTETTEHPSENREIVFPNPEVAISSISLEVTNPDVPSGTFTNLDNTEFSGSSPVLGVTTRLPSEEDEIASSDPNVPSGTLSNLDNTEFSGSSPVLGATTRCPPLQISEGVVAHCMAQDKRSVSCDQAPAGILARLECQPYYVSTFPLPTTHLKCGEDGTWKSLGLFGCKAQCGIIQNKNTEAYIANGQPTSKDRPFPWNAALFQKDLNGNYDLICGASLIETNVAVTAAHCTRDSSGKSRLHQGLKIVLGGNSSIFEVNEKTAGVQVFQIIKIVVPVTYSPFTLQSDIALIWLERGAVYNDHVRPVCYLLQDFFNIPPAGTLGKVAGYGYTTEQKLSEYLKQASFPVIAPADCLFALRTAPAFGTFCAGYQNGTSVCPGDSGGGMVFLDERSRVERYVLKGVVSRGDGSYGGRICNPNNYAVFTHVGTYADFILQNIFSWNDGKALWDTD